MVIATYNRCEDLRECLHSIFDMPIQPYEVIVVDSNSHDATRKLEVLFPIKFASIKERNRQRARNLGISLARGDIVAFLDDDVVVCEEWLDAIAKPYVEENVGGVGGRVLPYGASGSYVKTRTLNVGRVFDNGLVLGNFDTPSQGLVEVDSFIGCNMSFKRDLLLDVNGFDENFIGTGYRDDTDLCVRVSKLGYRLLYNSDATVRHKFRGKSVDENWSYWYVRNHVYFYLKNLFAQYRLKFLFFLYYIFMPPRDYVLKSAIKVKIEPILVLNVTKGIFDGYRMWRKADTYAT